MKRISFTVLSIFFTLSISSQETVVSIDNPFDSNSQNDKESYAISNELNNELVILLKGKKNCKASLYNLNYQKQLEIVTDPLPKRYGQILGYNIREHSYSIFLSNNNFSKFGVLYFDFDNKTSLTKKLDFYINNNEEYIESINYQNKIYVITSTIGTSDLNFYNFDNNYKTNKTTVTFSDIESPDPYDPDYLITLNYLLAKEPRRNIDTHKKITKIELNNPNAIETTSKKNKLFVDKDRLIFSIDYFDDETILCFMDLKTYKASVKTFDKPFKTEEGYLKSNSYFFDNKLFQIASSFKKMKFTVTDLESEKIIKEYSILRNDSITFKNSPIIQEGGALISKNSIREMEKTTKYLRKISLGDLGISVFKTKQKYNVILGGTKEIPKHGPVPQLGGAFELYAGPFVASFNPTGFGYSRYAATKSTYIKCLFNTDFEHLKGDVPKNVFDLIDEYDETVKKPLAKNVFLHNNIIHYGFFDQKNKVYKLLLFDN